MSHACCQIPADDEREALPIYDASPDLALAAVLSLMSRFPSRRSPAVAQSIVSHLQVISRDERIDVRLRERAAYLIFEWQAMAVLTGPLDGKLQ